MEPVGAFEEFYRASYPSARQLATLLAGPDRAEDVVQEAFWALYERFDTVSNPGGYLRVAVVNRAKDRFRSHDRRVYWERVFTGGERGTFEDEHRELLDMVGRLPYDQRAVLVLRLWMGWPDAEIASALDCAPGTVRSHASRALTALRREMADALD